MTTTIPLYPLPTGGHAGYCTLVEAHGSDEQIVSSARMSTDGAFRGWGPTTCQACGGTGFCGELESLPTQPAPCEACKAKGTVPGDEKLLTYMWKNQHASPFEFAGAVFEFQVPIFVIRQIHRHRAASYSELSARYTELPEAFWLPPAEDVRQQGGSNRQGSVASTELTWTQTSHLAIAMMTAHFEDARRTYEELLAMGVAKEQARAVLPVAQITRCRMAANLRMLTHFLGLRLDPHAQPECRVLAEAMATQLRGSFPRTMALFDESRAG